MAAKVTPAYHHEPLNTSRDQVRLLRIVTTYTSEKSVSIKLETHDLETAPPYIALSYAWENPDLQYQNITYPVNIEESSIRVGRTLHTALIELRDRIQELSEDSPLVDFPLWVDQICIDQSNIAERNHRVMMMASIYQSAERVIVWLFEAHLEPDDLDLTLMDLSNESDYACMECIPSAFRAIYWTRLWLVQEVLLAKERHVLCPGGLLISWRRMGDLHNHYKRDFVNKSVCEITELLSKSLENIPMPLDDAIDRFCSQQCKDPRDKVYALQGIVMEEEQVLVDYHEPVHTVFMDVVQVLHVAYVTNFDQVADPSSIYRGDNQRFAIAGNDLQNHLGILARELDLHDTIFDQTSNETNCKRQGLAALLKNLFHGHRNAWLLTCARKGYPMEIGYVNEAFCASARSSTIPGQWWVEFEGQRRYYH